MTKKKDDQQNDLTRIEDLSEFLHQEDSDLDSKFESFHSPDPVNNDFSSTGISLDALDEETPPEVPPEIPQENTEEVSFDFTEENQVEGETEETLDENPFEENTFVETSFEEPITDFETEGGDTFVQEIDLAESGEDQLDEVENFQESSFSLESETEEEVLTNTTEKFEDVKTFAQNFSYGKATVGGGNPPYSIIVRHIKYAEEAQDILELLKEFGVINAQNEKEMERALELGSLLIPQISEFTAIVIAHKLRRFDLDLEVGLSDEVHPSKSAEGNPRGLIKKDNLKQNRKESLKLTEIDTSIKDIIVSTSSTLPGYNVDSYIGVQTTFAIVDEAELERLQYVQKVTREQSDIINYEAPEHSELTSEKAFKDYENSFAHLYDDLTAQLKQKAFAQKANALLGLSFQLSPMQFERSHLRVNAYQITCSATLAVISRENT